MDDLYFLLRPLLPPVTHVSLLAASLLGWKLTRRWPLLLFAVACVSVLAIWAVPYGPQWDLAFNLLCTANWLVIGAAGVGVIVARGDPQAAGRDPSGPDGVTDSD